MFLQERICSNCTKPFQAACSAHISPDLCDKCQKIEDEKEKNKWLKNWRKNLTLRQRVEKIEEYIYKNKDHRHFSIYDKIG